MAVAAGYCDPPLPSRYDPAFAPQADFEAALTPALLAPYPRRNLLTANAIGILPALRELLALQEAAKRQPGHRRANQAAGYLKALDDRRTQRLNVLSISAGAASGIGTTVIADKPGQYTFGIGGGLLATGLGLLALRQSGHTVDFLHPRNLLGGYGPSSRPATFYRPACGIHMLTNPAFSNSGHTSSAHSTRQRWQRYGQLANPDPKGGKALTALLFGPGSEYSADRLTVRVNRLNELHSAVRLLNQKVLNEE